MECLDLLSIIDIDVFSSIVDDFDCISLCFDHKRKWECSLGTRRETDHAPGHQQSYKNCWLDS